MGEILRQILPGPVKEALMKGYTFVLERYFFNSRLRCYPPILVFQMGKVGSTSIYESLLRVYPGVVLHAHKFYPRHPNWKIRRLYGFVVSKKRPLNIISLTREPIGRNISAFFQNFKRDTGVHYAKANIAIEDLGSLFLSRYKHEIPLKWFDKNIQENFGIDVYAAPFPECGFATYSNANVRLLVMRCEISDQEKVRAIHAFLGLKHFELVKRNVGEEKEYAQTYREFKNKVKLPPNYIAKFCESRYFKHFYDAAVIEKVKRRWSAN